MKSSLKKTLLLVGGDARLTYTAKMLAKNCHDYEVKTLAVPDTAALTGSQDTLHYDILVLPVPTSTDGTTVFSVQSEAIPLASLYDLANPHALVLTGACRADVRQGFLTAGLSVVDYMEREELALANAVPTAEGAIQIAMEKLPITLQGCSALILGYVRLGMALAPRLKAIGVDTKIAARRSEVRAMAKMLGFSTVCLSPVVLAACVSQTRLIINTIPSLILTEELLSHVPADSLIIDLASRPGGTDFEAAKRLHRNVEWALALPGKTSPQTAGEHIGKTILNILTDLTERGISRARPDR